MRILVAQLNPTVGALAENAAAIRDGISQAEQAGVELAVFPELAITGYPPRDLVHQSAFVARNLESARAVAAATRSTAALFGFVDRDPAGQLYNAAAFARGGVIEAVARKLLLPTYDVFDEDRYFRPGSDPLLISHAGRRLGIAICEDVWNDAEFWGRARYDREPVADLARRGMDALIAISASPFSTGRVTLRYDMMRAHARRHHIPVVYLNQVGGNDALVFDGSSFVLDREGIASALLPSFAAATRIIDLDAKGSEPRPGTNDAELAWDALVLGLGDYVHKCGFRKVVLGLSGGIDSALTLCLAVSALGRDNVNAAFMPSRFSSRESREDVEALAQALGIRLLDLDIEPAFTALLSTLEPQFAGLPFSTAEENLQARIRGNLLMALSNKFGWLVLSTGNKSELAVGYCTLYGDMSGGLAVISDLPKTMVYEVARVANRRLATPIPERIFVKAPSAELRENQTDQDSLPPYELLDRVLRAYIEDELSPAEIVDSGLDPALVSRVVAMVDRNEYKRQQAAPGLRVTSKAFGVGRRMPIAQSWSDPLHAAAGASSAGGARPTGIRK